MIDPNRTVEDVSRALKGVSFPTSKPELLARRGETPIRGVAPTRSLPLRAVIEPLPEDVFATPEALTQALLTRWREEDGRFRFLSETRD